MKKFDEANMIEAMMLIARCRSIVSREAWLHSPENKRLVPLNEELPLPSLNTDKKSKIVSKTVVDALRMLSRTALPRHP
jgi:hypothetical protein